VAQGWFVLSYLLKKRKKQPSRTYQEPTRRAASFPVEQEKEYAAQ
jgi:hypothetical protein